MTNLPLEALRGSLLDLPVEILDIICHDLKSQNRNGSLATLLQCSHKTYDLVAPFLYREIELTWDNAPQILFGLDLVWVGIHPREENPFDYMYRRLVHEELRAEWERLYGEKPDKLRAQYKTWPNVDKDSWDEDEEWDAGVEDDIVWVDGHKHNSKTAEELEKERDVKLNGQTRKLHLLGMVKKLIISEIPAPSYSRGLGIFCRSHGTIFESLTNLIIKPVAFWTLVNYRDSREKQHPFEDFWKSMHPLHICIQLPIADEHLEKSYILPRLVTDYWGYHAERLQDFHPINSDQDMLDAFDRGLRECVRIAFAEEIAHLTEQHRPSRVTIHNAIDLSGEHLPSQVPMCIFFRMCGCRDEDNESSIIEERCYDHWTRSGRIDTITNIINKVDANVDYIFVDADRVCRDGETTARRIRNFRDIAFERSQLAKREFRGGFVFVRNVDAEPCECCGQKQLSYEESSIDPRDDYSDGDDEEDDSDDEDGEDDSDESSVASDTTE